MREKEARRVKSTQRQRQREKERKKTAQLTFKERIFGIREIMRVL